MESYRDRYTEYMLKIRGFSKEHVDQCLCHINKYIDFLHEKNVYKIDEVAREHLDQFQKKIMERKEIKNISKISILTAVRCFFKYLYNYDYIDDNIGLIIEVPKKGTIIPRNIMNNKELAFLLTLPNKNDLSDLTDFCIMVLLYSSAMRLKEIFNIRLSDIDFKRKQILVRRPKNKCDRIVHIDGYTAHYLKKYIKEARPWLSSKRENMDVLFFTQHGTSFNRNAFLQRFKRKYSSLMYEKFKKHITPYSFRHTSATHWLDEGVKHKKDLLPYVQRQLGHKSLESTAIYTRVAIEPLREMFKKYHPRDLTLKKLNKIPSPDDIISPLEDEEKP